jgi:hypothetical protein
METEDVFCEVSIEVSYITYVNVSHQVTHFKADYLIVMTAIKGLTARW